MLLRVLEIGRAMRAAHRCDGNIRGAEGAGFDGRFCRGCFLFTLQAVDRLDHTKHGQCHDQETDHRIQEQADIHRHRASSLGVRQGGVGASRFRARLEQDEQVAEIHLASSKPIGGMMMSATRDDTMVPNAPPMTTPTARSTTFPRMTNSLNSFNMFSS